MFALTGASGYLGSRLLPALCRVDSRVVTLGRRKVGTSSAHRALDLSGTDGFRDALDGVETLIHCGGLAHNKGASEDYDRINVRATMALADAALNVGVRKLIYLSSLNVVPAGSKDPCASIGRLPLPADHYARSKWRAEQSLENLLSVSGCELVIVRPALVYDTELTANLASLAGILRQWPLRLPERGCRSMVARPDVVARIVQLATTDAATQHGVRRVAVTDGECYTAGRIGRALSHRGWIGLPMPVWQLAGAYRDKRHGLARGTSVQSIVGDYWCGRSTADADWSPAHTFESLTR